MANEKQNQVQAELLSSGVSAAEEPAGSDASLAYGTPMLGCSLVVQSETKIGFTRPIRELRDRETTRKVCASWSGMVRALTGWPKTQSSER